MSKHTPGPWWLSHEPEDNSYDIGAGDYVHARVKLFRSGNEKGFPRGYYRDGLTSANARLIVSAPDLLAACKAIKNFQYLEGDEKQAIQFLQSIAKEAIIKAEGRQND